MSMVNSPKLKYQAGGARERPPARAYVVRALTLLCVAVSVTLLLLLWFGSDVLNLATGRTGAVQGIVLDEQGQPLSDSEVFLLREPKTSTRTDGQGHFVLENIPGGAHAVVVSRGNWGQEYRVTVQGRQVTDAGTLTFLTPPPVD